MTTLIDHVVNTRLEFEVVDDKVTNYLSWQSTKDGRAAKLPKIEESHKEIVFRMGNTVDKSNKELPPGPTL